MVHVVHQKDGAPAGPATTGRDHHAPAAGPGVVCAAHRRHRLEQYHEGVTAARVVLVYLAGRTTLG